MDEEDPSVLEKDPPQPIPILHAQVVYDVLWNRGPSPRPTNGEGRLGDECEIIEIDFHGDTPWYLTINTYNLLV